MNWMNKTLAAAVVGFGAALSVAAPAQAEIKIALDSPMDLKNAGTSVWAHHFAEHLKANGMATEYFERGALGGAEGDEIGFAPADLTRNMIGEPCERVQQGCFPGTGWTANAQ